VERSSDDEHNNPAQLSDSEREKVEERRAVPATVVYEAILVEGEEELARPAMSLAFSGLAAGLSMGFSLVALGLLRSALPDTPWRPLIVNAGYTLGFLIVILGRQQLFTENTLTPILPLLQSPNLATAGKVLRLWAIVLAANIVGAIAFAYVMAHAALFKPVVTAAIGSIGHEACCEGFTTVVVRSIFAGWLIALMVWLLPGAENARAPVIMIITYIVGLAGFNHVIAGSVEVLYDVMRGGQTWSAYWLQFFFPTLLGNVIGGIVLVTALSYGQVVAERKAAA